MAGPVRFLPTGTRFTAFRREYYEDPTKRRRTTVLLDGSQAVEELNYRTRIRRKKIRLCLLKVSFGLLILLIIFFVVEYYVYEVDVTIEVITFGSILIILILILILVSICETYCQKNRSNSENLDLELPSQPNAENNQTPIQNSMETLPPDYTTIMMEEKKPADAVEPPPPVYGILGSEE